MSNPVAKLEVDPNPVLAVGQFPSPFPKDAFFYRLGKQTDWGPHTNGNLRFFLTDADFDETWLKAVLGMLDYGSIIQKPFIQKLWQPCHSQTFS